MRFTDTINKQSIRKYDKKIIEQFVNKKGNRLSYFGLPGAEMLDILEWKEYIQKIVAVEIDENDYESLILTALSKGLTANFKAIKGDIDKMILDEKDINIPYPFNLINLDYSGGALYIDKYGESERVEAWKKLFQRQKDHKEDFLLLMTLNARERARGEIDRALDEIKEEILKYRDTDICEAIEWYKGSKENYKFMVYIPYSLRATASFYKYWIKCYSPILYLGSSSRPMTHFIFELTYVHGRATHTPFQQSLLDILECKAMECTNGDIKECEIKGAKILRKLLTQGK